MARNTTQFLRWAARAAGILMVAFLALFALDAFQGRSFVAALPYFGMHLIPSLLVLAIVAAAWRVEWFGAAACLALALGYAFMANWRLDWIIAISGPLVLVSGLFFASWLHRGAAGAR